MIMAFNSLTYTIGDQLHASLKNWNVNNLLLLKGVFTSGYDVAILI